MPAPGADGRRGGASPPPGKGLACGPVGEKIRTEVAVKDALDIHRELLSRDVPHEIIRLPRTIGSAEEIPEVTGLPASQCASVRFYLVNERTLVATLTPAGQAPRPGAVLEAVGGVTVELAGADVVNQRTDYAAHLPGPLLLPPDVAVLVDRRLADTLVVYAPTGDAGTLLGIGTAELIAATGARVVDLLAGELAAAP